MTKFKFQKSGNPESLLGSKVNWRAAETGSVRFEKSVALERRGRKDAEVAQVTTSTEVNKEYKITVSAVDIVGKIQIAILGKPILTITEPGTSSVNFKAAGKEQNISIRCVAQTNARAKISTFEIHPVAAS